MRFDVQEGVDPRDDADGVAPQLVVLEGQIAGAGRRRPQKLPVATFSNRVCSTASDLPSTVSRDSRCFNSFVRIALMAPTASSSVQTRRWSLSIARSQSVPERARETTRKVIEFLGFLGLVVIGLGRRRR